MLRVACKVVVLIAVCFVTGAKVRHQGIACPVAVTQELNRCLSMLRAASSKNPPNATHKRQAFGMHDRRRRRGSPRRGCGAHQRGDI